MNKKQLQERYGVVMKEAEDIRLKYDGKSQDMPGDELERWEKAIGDCDIIKKQLELLEKQESLNAWSKKAKDMRIVDDNAPVDDAKVLERKAFGLVLKTNQVRTAAERDIVMKAYQSDNPASGGFLVTPQEFAQELIVLLKDLVFIRAKARVIPLDKAESLGIGAIDVDPSDPDWTSELLAGNEETTIATGKRELKPHPVAKLLKLSKKLLRQAAFDVEAEFMDRMAYKFGLVEEKAFLSGSGAEQPLGVFTASANGISTGRDVTAANNNKVVADDLITTKYKLKAAYRNRAEWILHRDVVAQVRMLKDANNNYIWATGIGPGNGYQGTPDTLLNIPLNESEYAPNTFTTGLYMAILGDFSKYAIVDALDMQVQVLQELYALTNQMGYVCRKETDGQPVLEEAFIRLKLA